VAIALFVLWGLRPWEDNSAEPHEVPLGIEAAVGGGKALPPASTVGVAAGVAAPVGPKVQAAQRASGHAAPAPSRNSAPAPVAVAPAQSIAVAEVPSSPTGSAPESGAGEEVPSVGTTAGEVPPEGTSSPVATPAGPSEGSQGPVTAGAKPPVLESCEGDEYVITVTFLDGEATVEEAPVGIVLTKLSEDGMTTDELKLEGDLSDVHVLASTLEEEGNCVKVEIAPLEGEGAEEEAEEPGASDEVPETGDEAPESGEEVTAPAESPVPSSP
jgi:hypothetical protein